MIMDYGTLRGLVALLILALFIIIVAWSYSRKRKSSFDQIANSIFDETSEPNIDSHNKNISKQETNNNV
jgi:cytochrome c oxidase cbb3-type subunit 4